MGSTFTLTLPRQGETATADEPTEGETAQPMATEPLALPTRTTQVPVVGNTTATHAQTLVVVDDDALQIRLTEAMLRNVAPDKATILTFLATDDFFAWLGEGHLPDMLFTDIEMPGRTGYEVLAFLRKREGGDHIPVIATTSRPDSSRRLQTTRFYGGAVQTPFTKRFAQGSLSDTCLARGATARKVRQRLRPSRPCFSSPRETPKRKKPSSCNSGKTVKPTSNGCSRLCKGKTKPRSASWHTNCCLPLR